jgi:V8-like Glu-specific endopeptidase
MGTGLGQRLGTAAIGATLTLAAAALTGGAASAATSTAPHGTPATHAVTRAVSAAAQAATRSFWTTARMESATPAGRVAANVRASTPSAAPSPTPSATPSPPPGTPNPTSINGVPTVGALFFTTGSKAHFCTASVVNSTTQNLVLTAAHCVYGSTPAANITYVPEWHEGVSPFGSWAVQSVTVASGWQTSHNPALDFAFLRITPPASSKKPIQAVTGGLSLSTNAGYAHPIYVIGYNDTGSQPIGCSTTSFEFESGQMEFYCNSFWDGTSGGPWIVHFDSVTGSGDVIGNIGGYEQGGDEPWASFSDYYSSSILALFAQAQ